MQSFIPRDVLFWHQLILWLSMKYVTSVCAPPDYLPLIVVFQTLCRKGCQIRTVHLYWCFHTCYLSGGDPAIHYLEQEKKNRHAYILKELQFIQILAYLKSNYMSLNYPPEDFCYCIFIIFRQGCKQAVRTRCKEHTKTSHEVRNMKQIDCSTEIKLLASN